MTEIRACVRVSHVRACAIKNVKKICRLKNYIYLCLEIKLNIMDAEFYLNRYEISKGRTFGFMSLDGVFFGDTLEKTTRLIPAGTYELETRKSPSFGRRMVYLKNVPHRSCIMIHPGNLVSDTNGCILLGERDGLILKNSRYTVARFFEIYSKYDNVNLTITE